MALRFAGLLRSGFDGQDRESVLRSWLSESCTRHVVQPLIVCWKLRKLQCLCCCLCIVLCLSRVRSGENTPHRSNLAPVTHCPGNSWVATVNQESSQTPTSPCSTPLAHVDSKEVLRVWTFALTFVKYQTPNLHSPLALPP